MEKYEEYKGYYYKITQDNFAESPDDWSNTDIFLVYNHRQFQIVRCGFDPHSIYESDEYIKTNKYKDFNVYPVYAYIHSGVSLSLSNSFYDKFDTSCSGFVLVHESINEPNLVAEDLIKLWNLYLSGEVYYFTIYEKEICDKCNHVEYVEKSSCSGFYGYDDCLKEVKNEIDAYVS